MAEEGGDVTGEGGETHALGFGGKKASSISCLHTNIHENVTCTALTVAPSPPKDLKSCQLTMNMLSNPDLIHSTLSKTCFVDFDYYVICLA